MKTTNLSPAKLAQRQRRKKMLLWQGEQIKRFRPFVLAREAR